MSLQRDGLHRAIDAARLYSCALLSPEITDMEATILFFGPLPCSLERLEDAVEDELQHQGEIIGAGLNAAGGNIDVRFRGRAYSKDAAIGLLRRAFAEFSVSRRGKIVIDGEEFPLA